MYKFLCRKIVKFCNFACTLRLRVAVCLENMKIYHIFTLTIDINNLLSEFGDIHHQIFLPKFHENSADSLPLNLNLNQVPLVKLDFFMKLWKEDLPVNIFKFTQGFLDLLSK